MASAVVVILTIILTLICLTIFFALIRAFCWKSFLRNYCCDNTVQIPQYQIYQPATISTSTPITPSAPPYQGEA